MDVETRDAGAGSGQATLRVGGLTPLTTIDFPGQLAAVVYCQSCPWRCRYCHNGHLLAPGGQPSTSWQTTLAFLERRRGLLDAVVFSGGEPTAQSALPEAIEDVHAMGYLAGLHTGGAYPERLQRVLPLLNWVGLDIKALPEDYPALTGVAGSGTKAWESLDILLATEMSFDVRVTVHDALLPTPRLALLLDRLHNTGVARPVLQTCRSEHMLDPTLGPGRGTTPPIDRSAA